MEEAIKNQIDKLKVDLFVLLKQKNDEFYDKTKLLYGAERFKNMNCQGKMLRGLLVLLSYFAYGEGVKNKDEVLPLAVAMEFLQTSTLIQDDVIDESPKRRKMDSVHIALCKDKNSPFVNEHREAKAAASQIGAIGLAYSTWMIHEKYSGDLIDEYYDMLVNTIHGEALDILVPLYDGINASEINDDVRKALAFEIASRKTAVYSFEAPIVMGIILAGGDRNSVYWARKLGQKLGRAYQLSNDWKAIEELKNEKYSFSDIEPYRISYTNALAIEIGEERFRELLIKNDKTRLEKEWLQQNYPYNDVFERLEEERRKNYLEAIDLIDSEECTFTEYGKELLKKYLEQFREIEISKNG